MAGCCNVDEGKLRKQREHSATWNLLLNNFGYPVHSVKGNKGYNLRNWLHGTRRNQSIEIDIGNQSIQSVSIDID